MKNVRIWFKKDNEARYISHLDLNRTMNRALIHSHIPIWHTEGFNPHPFSTYALPLSLGFRGVRESMDVRLVDDMPFDEIIKKMNDSLPTCIQVYDITEPKMKSGDVAFGKFLIKMDSTQTSAEQLCKAVNHVLSMDEIPMEKKTKKGTFKTIDLKEYIGEHSVKVNGSTVDMEIMLPAGSTTNINPMLLIKAIEKINNTEIYADVTRLNIYNKEVLPFE